MKFNEFLPIVLIFPINMLVEHSHQTSIPFSQENSFHLI